MYQISKLSTVHGKTLRHSKCLTTLQTTTQTSKSPYTISFGFTKLKIAWAHAVNAIESLSGDGFSNKPLPEPILSQIHGVIWHLQASVVHWGFMEPYGISNYRSWSSLVQIMVCCLTAPSHHPNQCHLLVNDTLKKKHWYSMNIFTLNMLNYFKDYKRYIHILNHILDLAWPK